MRSLAKQMPDVIEVTFAERACRRRVRILLRHDDASSQARIRHRHLCLLNRRRSQPIQQAIRKSNMSPQIKPLTSSPGGNIEPSVLVQDAGTAPATSVDNSSELILIRSLGCLSERSRGHCRRKVNGEGLIFPSFPKFSAPPERKLQLCWRIESEISVWNEARAHCATSSPDVAS
ncbi:hypothetical protein EVAR_90200_1 [Eumeta japonica]|uniref:Uncharacterized protein n=1 Tax=Eumeta variegata TaxID=151549 RepID=A0A4C1WUS7_EUMVA|nr:hypothetical protein EVAR_90200_1 [Eumeta japonica]